MFKEFQEFINQGNVLDLAVAVVLGAAFGAITASLVNEVIMPPIGLLLGGVDFSNLGIILSGQEQYNSVAQAVAAGAPVIRYGLFLNTVINFFIVAFAIFLVVKGYTGMRARFVRQQVDAEDPVATAEELLLVEIRDLLKQQLSQAPIERSSNNEGGL